MRYFSFYIVVDVGRITATYVRVCVFAEDILPRAHAAARGGAPKDGLLEWAHVLLPVLDLAMHISQEPNVRFP